MSEGSLAFNPEFDPDGAEGGVDTNLLPWLEMAGASGIFTEAAPGQHGERHVQYDCAARKGRVLERLLSLSGMDLLVLSGALDLRR